MSTTHKTLMLPIKAQLNMEMLPMDNNKPNKPLKIKPILRISIPTKPKLIKEVKAKTTDIKVGLLVCNLTTIKVLLQL